MNEEFVWKGEFKSTTYPFIYGRLKVKLRKLGITGYETKVSVQFDGFASIISSIFKSVMEPKITVCDGNKFTTNVGLADVVFYISSNMNENTSRIEGNYISTVKAKKYESHGKFFLIKQD